MAKYAYLASAVDNGLTVIDISVPTAPTYAGGIYGAGSPNYLGGACGLKVKGNYAYLACITDDSLTIIDISDPTTPTLAGSIQGAGAPNYLNSAWDVDVWDKHAFVASAVDDALSIFDVSDPTSPTFKGVYQQSSKLNVASGVSVIGEKAYVTARSGTTDGSISVVDVSDPTAPVELGYIGAVLGGGSPNYLEGAWGVHARKGRYIYVCSTDDNVLTVIDISTPASPSVVGAVGSASSPQFMEDMRAVHVMGIYAYCVSYAGDAMSIYDVSDPTSPTYVSGGTISGAGTPNYLQGAYDIKISGDYAYISAELDHALVIVDISTPASPSLAGVIRGAGSPNFLSNVRDIAIPVTEYPSGALTRVTGLRHVFFPGMKGQKATYNLTAVLGGISAFTDYQRRTKAPPWSPQTPAQDPSWWEQFEPDIFNP